MTTSSSGGSSGSGSGISSGKRRKEWNRDGGNEEGEAGTAEEEGGLPFAVKPAR